MKDFPTDSSSRLGRRMLWLAAIGLLLVPFAGRLNTDKFYMLIIEEGRKQSDCIGATTNTGRDNIRQFSVF